MKANNYKIYFHINPNTKQVFYVGQSKTKKRPHSRLGRNILWHRYVEKYGFETKIVHDGITKTEANALEMKYIKEMGRKCFGTGPLVNLTDGADGGHGIFLSDETKRKMSVAHMGDKNIMYGKTHSPEARAKISFVQKGRARTQEQKDLVRHFQTGRIKSPQEIEKLRQCKLGKPRPDWVRKKVSDSRKDKKSILAVKDCAIIQYDSLTQASRELCRDRKTINDALLKGFTCNGYKLYYAA